MSKNANGEGTVYQRKDGRWTAATYVLRPDGGRQRRQVYGSTRAEVASRLRDLITLTERGIPAAGAATTVAEYSAHWLEHVAKRSLRPSTVSNYSWMLRKYVIPAVGSRRLDRLTPAHVRKLHADVAAAGVSARTQQLAHAVLRSMLSEAVREELVGRNVASLVKSPRPEKREVTPWSIEELDLFRIAAAGHRLETLFLLAYSLGLRRGELLGLRWEDLDLDGRMLHVRQTLQRLGAGTGRVLGPPKTGRSRRSIPLPASVATALLELRPARIGDSGLVFTTAAGTPLEPSNLRRDFDSLIERAGVRRIRFHDLRHTCASLLFAQGVPPRVVMDVLGHSTLAVTTDIYAHVMPSTLIDAASSMDALLMGTRVEHDELDSSGALDEQRML